MALIAARLNADVILLVTVWRYVYNLQSPPTSVIVQELCESRGGRTELSVLTSLLASVDVKIY